MKAEQEIESAQVVGKIKNILQERGITQRSLSKLIMDKCGVNFPEPRVSNLVNGRVKNMSLKTAAILAKALDVTIDDICEF